VSLPNLHRNSYPCGEQWQPVLVRPDDKCAGSTKKKRWVPRKATSQAQLSKSFIWGYVENFHVNCPNFLEIVLPFALPDFLTLSSMSNAIKWHLVYWEKFATVVNRTNFVIKLPLCWYLTVSMRVDQENFSTHIKLSLYELGNFDCVTY